MEKMMDCGSLEVVGFGVLYIWEFLKKLWFQDTYFGCS
jgi:hypothetical protein